MEACRASGAIVVDIVDGNLRHAELVEDPLAAGGVAIAVAGDTLVDIIVIDLGIEEGFDPRLEAEFRVVDYAYVRETEDLRERVTYLCLGV